MSKEDLKVMLGFILFICFMQWLVWELTLKGLI